MKVPCPICGKMTEYSRENPWRPVCSERCKMIDLGEWGNDGYRIQGEPGSADRMSPEEFEDAARRADELRERLEAGKQSGARGRRR